MTRKILYSPGFGAGWVSWEHDDITRQVMLTYAPIIEAIERGDDVTEQHPAVLQMIAELDAQGAHLPYLGGLCGLTVTTVSGPIRINEYDGSESIIEQGESEGWM